MSTTHAITSSHFAASESGKVSVDIKMSPRLGLLFDRPLTEHRHAYDGYPSSFLKDVDSFLYSASGLEVVSSGVGQEDSELVVLANVHVQVDEGTDTAVALFQYHNTPASLDAKGNVDERYDEQSESEALNRVDKAIEAQLTALAGSHKLSLKFECLESMWITEYPANK